MPTKDKVLSPVGKPRKRQVLSLLPRQDLADFAENYGLALPDSSPKPALVAALTASKKARLSEMLAMLTPEQLRELCRALGMKDRDAAKAELVERIEWGLRSPPGAATPSAPAAPRRPQRRVATQGKRSLFQLALASVLLGETPGEPLPELSHRRPSRPARPGASPGDRGRARRAQR